MVVTRYANFILGRLSRTKPQLRRFPTTELLADSLWDDHTSTLITPPIAAIALEELLADVPLPVLGVDTNTKPATDPYTTFNLWEAPVQTDWLEEAPSDLPNDLTNSSDETASQLTQVDSSPLALDLAWLDWDDFDTGAATVAETLTVKTYNSPLDTDAAYNFAASEKAAADFDLPSDAPLELMQDFDQLDVVALLDELDKEFLENEPAKPNSLPATKNRPQVKNPASTKSVIYKKAADSTNTVKLEEFSKFYNRKDITAYIKEVNSLPPLDNETIIDLTARKNQGDKEAHKALIQFNQQMVVSIARTYQKSGRKSGLDFYDLIVLGNNGLEKAVDEYNSQMDYKFSIHATPLIHKAISEAVAK